MNRRRALLGLVLIVLLILWLTGNIAAGTVWVNTLQTIAPNFQGYMFAVCNFQYAHGYYFPSAIKLREFMRHRYGKSRRSRLVVKNVPPAYTLTWSTK